MTDTSKTTFQQALANGSSIAAAAEAAGVSKSTGYKWAKELPPVASQEQVDELNAGVEFPGEEPTVAPAGPEWTIPSFDSGDTEELHQTWELQRVYRKELETLTASLKKLEADLRWRQNPKHNLTHLVPAYEDKVAQATAAIAGKETALVALNEKEQELSRQRWAAERAVWEAYGAEVLAAFASRIEDMNLRVVQGTDLSFTLEQYTGEVGTGTDRETGEPFEYKKTRYSVNLYSPDVRWTSTIRPASINFSAYGQLTPAETREVSLIQILAADMADFINAKLGL